VGIFWIAGGEAAPANMDSIGFSSLVMFRRAQGRCAEADSLRRANPYFQNCGADRRKHLSKLLTTIL